MAVIAFDSLGTLFDLGELEPRMPAVLHHALSLAVCGGWMPLDEVAAAIDPDLAERLPGLLPFDDARPALELVRENGDEAWILTNGGRDSTLQLLERGGLAELVAQVRSAEEVQRYKPQPEVYALLPQDATLIAAHAWDVAGAVAAGRRAVWANHAGRPWPYEATPRPKEAPDLTTAVKRLRRPPE